MGNKELDKIPLTTESRVLSIFTEFMSRTAKLDDLVDAGKRFLMRFDQELGYFRRPQINKDLIAVSEIIKCNMTERMKSYLDATCTHSHQNVQNLSQLHNCMLGLQDILKKAKALLDESGCLAENAYKVVTEADQNVLGVIQEHVVDPLENQTIFPEDQVDTFDAEEKSASYASMMMVIYNMLKLDYTMQEKIVQSLSLTTSLSELETYCQMWNLRPYVDDDVMRHAWKSMP
ncbi:FAD binding protein [Rhynchospora pubera]|uniref:FAD binding protein n=1 Tax=Rhynchospora pubera TaxID=906938 RepID=A0AAV8C2Y1_9POAL|nr:FAD binding protein [Rhynchospora pubera]